MGDQEQARNLICDQTNGIIIGEVAYRCMKCVKVFDLTSDLQAHYRAKHGSPKKYSTSHRKQTTKNPVVNGHLNGSHTKSSLGKRPIHHNQNHQHLQDLKDESSEAAVRSSENTLNAQEDMQYEENVPQQPECFGELDQQISDPLPDSQTINEYSMVSDSNVHSNTSPFRPPAVENVKPQGSSNGGFINCEVCGLTKFYSHLARRFGIFACEGCAKFFRRYLLKPRKYICAHSGQCDIGVEGIIRCRACLLNECLSKFKVDLKKYPAAYACHKNDELQRLSGNYQLSSDMLDPSCVQESNEHFNAYNGTDTIAEDKRLDGEDPINGAVSDPIPQADDVDESFELTPDVSQYYDEDENGEEEFTGSPCISHLKLQSSESSPISLTLQRSLAARGLIIEKPSPGSSGRKGRQVDPGSRKGGCKQCEACLSEDCGVCIYCLDKPKFGGSYTKKQRCIKRRCMSKYIVS